MNYDDNTWSSIAKILHKSHSTIHVINRAEVSKKHFSNSIVDYVITSIILSTLIS